MESGEVFGLVLVLLFYLAVAFFYGYCMWRIFEKANRKGWEGIVPVYNSVVMAEVAGKPGWWGVLTLIPFAGIVFSIWIWNLFLKRFGKDETWTVLIILFGFIMIPVLAFEKNTFIPYNAEEDIKNIGNRNN